MVGLSSPFSEKQYARLEASLKNIAKTEQLYEKIVNSPFDDRLLSATIDIGIVVLLLVNKANKTIDRIALSDTEHAHGAVSVSAKPFHKIIIPLGDEKNIIAKAIKEKKGQATDDWQYLFTPALSAEAARLNQKAASIESSIVWPLSIKDGGALIFSCYQPLSNIGPEHYAFAKRYAAIVSKALKA